jgi:hypothetical protein
MTLNITPQLEEQLLTAAQLEGIEPATIAEQLILEHLPERIAKDMESQRRGKLVTEIMDITHELGLYE